MEWCRLYANLDDDPRVQAAEDAAENSAWLLVQSMMYCTAAETQGFIPRTQVPRFGGRNIDQRTKALVGEGCWIPNDRGYLLAPDLWSEERNLSDQAERKRQADRDRMRAKRAAARTAQENQGDVSRDGRATVSGDSRTQRREEENYPPNPPQSGGDVSRCTRHTRKRRGCADCELPPLAPVPEQCPDCSPSRRIEGPGGIDLGPCPTCHPSTVRSA